MPLINFHSKVKRKKKRKKFSECWYHFQTVLSASKLTGNASSSHPNPVFIHNPVILGERKSGGKPHGDYFRTFAFLHKCYPNWKSLRGK